MVLNKVIIIRNDSHKSIQTAVQESSNTGTKSEPTDEVDGQNNETAPSTSNKENAKPSSDFVLRNRKNCTLLTVSFLIGII